MRILATILLVIILSSGANAMIETMDLEQLVHGADVILLGRINGVKATGNLPEGPQVIANLFEIEETLKGSLAAGEKIRIKTFNGVSDNASFKEGAKYLVFLKKSDSHFEVFNGIQGCWPVEKDKSFSGMGYGISIDQVKAAIESVPLKLQPKFAPLSL
jgi:hypothetical protein